MQVKAVYPTDVVCSFLVVKFNAPSKATSVSCEITNNQGNQKADYS